jgi:hypothetical protein
LPGIIFKFRNRNPSGFGTQVVSLQFNIDGTKLAAAGGFRRSQDAVIRIWDLETGEVQVLDPGDQKPTLSLQFGPDGLLYSSGQGGLRSWNLDAGNSELLIPDVVGQLSPDGRYFLGMHFDIQEGGKELTLYDLETGERRRLESHGDAMGPTIWHPSGKAIISTTRDGVIQVGKVTGEEPHLLFGHTGPISSIRVLPNGKWILSASETDGTLRLWPMPDLSKPPFHILPYEELMSRLKSMTNHRVVEDETSATGYSIQYDPLHWDTIPEW